MLKSKLFAPLTCRRVRFFMQELSDAGIRVSLPRPTLRIEIS